MKHAVDHWRKQFRGDAPVKDDTDVTDADIANSNLVLWGDPSSNTVLAKIADKLPIKWTDEGVDGRRQDLRRRHARPGADLPEPAEPEEVRRAQQRLHVPRVRLPEQRPAGARSCRTTR